MSLAALPRFWSRFRACLQVVVLGLTLLGLGGSNLFLSGQDSLYHHVGHHDQLTTDGGWMAGANLNTEDQTGPACPATDCRKTSEAKSSSRVGAQDRPVQDVQEPDLGHHHDHSHAQDTASPLRPTVASFHPLGDHRVIYGLTQSLDLKGYGPGPLKKPPQA